MQSQALILREALVRYLDEVEATASPRSWGVVDGAAVESDQMAANREKWAKEIAKEWPRPS